MENLRKSEKFIFEIKDSDINVQEIMEEIESSLKTHNVSRNEIDRISKLSFSPISPAGFREFDPSYTANLFEEGISAPKFSNPNLWFIKGPFKWIVVKLVEIYSFVDKKLSDNRIRAFYNVVHELIVLRSKNEILQKKFDTFYKEYLELKSRICEKVEPNFDTSTIKYKNSEFLEKSDKRIIEDVSKKSQKILVLYPEWGEFLLKLKLSKIEFESFTFSNNQFDFIQKKITDNIQLITDLNLLDFKNYDSIVFQCNANLIPNWIIEFILKKIIETANKNIKIYFRFSDRDLSFNSPFQPAYPTKIDPSSLQNFLKNFGFHNISKWETEEDEYCLFTFNTL